MMKKERGTAKQAGKIKVDDLTLNKETVKDLTDSAAKGIQGGAKKKTEPPESACAKGCLTWSHNYCPNG